MEPKLFVAVKAFIIKDNKILILRESQNYSDGTNKGKFDLAGGRIIPGQRFDESLIREVKEETGLNIQIRKPFFINEWRPIVRGESWHIIGIFFECLAESDKVKLSKDHDMYLWINPHNYNNYNIIENLKPVFEAYLKI